MRIKVYFNRKSYYLHESVGRLTGYKEGQTVETVEEMKRLIKINIIHQQKYGELIQNIFIGDFINTN